MKAAVAEGADIAGVYRNVADDLTRYATVLVGPGDAADVVHDAVIGVLSKRAVDDPRAYLFRAVLNQAISHHRSHARRRRREERATSTEPVVPATDATSIDAHRALAQLSKQQRAVVYLTYWDDLTPSQIAALLAISEGSVKKHLARARERLRRILDA